MDRIEWEAEAVRRRGVKALGLVGFWISSEGSNVAGFEFELEAEVEARRACSCHDFEQG